jgi:lipopolysaccharide transport system permease protein
MSGVTIIKPKKKLSLEDVRELWRYKELLYFFVWRDLKVRYKQTAIGVAWAVFQPFISMVVFSVFFGRLGKIPSDGIPYPIFVFTGLLFWQFFSSALSETSSTLTANQALITKVYFPRLILPIATVANKLLDFAISALILFGIMIYYGRIPHFSGLLIVPLLLLITFMLSVGSGLILSSINVKYRDVKHALPFFIQMLLFITPVIYPASIAGKFSWLLAINPMTGVLQSARATLLNTTPINWYSLLFSFISSVVLLIIGIIYFKKVEGYFADIL